MFGYAVANPQKLTEEQRLRYRAVYCGVCRAMGEGRPRRCRFALTYDLALVPLLLASVAEAAETEKQIRCGAHPFRTHAALFNEYTVYAADMNILLAFYHFLDDLKDDGGFAPAAEAALLWDEAQRVKEKYPGVAEAVSSAITALSAAERRDEPDPMVPAGCCGEILAAVFRDPALPCREALADFGRALGEAVYLMDAAVDVKADLKKKRYNPLIRTEPAARMRLLEFQMAECMRKYAALPLTRDREIVENILLSGIWTKYGQKVRPHTETREKQQNGEEGTA